MGDDGDKLLKSPKGKSVMSKIGDVLSPKKLKLKKNKRKSVDGSEDGDEVQQEVDASPTMPANTVKEESDDSDNKSEDIQFFYEGRRTSLDSGEFSLGSPFTAQFKEH